MLIRPALAAFVRLPFEGGVEASTAALSALEPIAPMLCRAPADLQISVMALLV